MKIAVSAQGASLESRFEPRFGRAPGFVIFDTESQQTTFLDNSSNQNLPQGAGIQTAQGLPIRKSRCSLPGTSGPRHLRPWPPPASRSFALLELLWVKP